MFKQAMRQLLLAMALLCAAGTQAQTTPSACPAWAADVIYTAGQCATYQSQTFKAKWWTQGTAPSTEVEGPWELDAQAGPTGCVPWTASATFTLGQCATYQGVDYVANWWTQGDVPSTQTAGPWQLKEVPNANGCVPWTEGAAYTAGQCATYQGVDYVANWWTQGNEPATDTTGVWTLVAPATLTVAITVPANNSQYAAPASIAIQTTVTGTPAKVEFYSGTKLLGISTQAPFSYNWTNVPAGGYSITAKATDDAGASTTSGVVDITVTAVSAASQVYYIYPDHLNAPRVIADQNNNVVWRWDSDAFGAALPDQDPGGSGLTFVFNPRFPGQYYDAETGLHYNYFRDYDPQTGRYVQSDPVGLLGGPNTYAYVEDNPLSMSDPRGLFSLARRNPNLNTIVCDGNGGIKVQVAPMTELARKCGLADCVIAHEESHKRDVMEKNPQICRGYMYILNQPAGRVITTEIGPEQNATEHKAWGVQARCFKEKLKQCMDKKCRDLIMENITEAERRQQHFGR